MDYLNFGDALSPVMVALLSGRQIRRVPTRSRSLRMAAVGTIGHGFAEGEVWFWGTGCSSWKNPSAPLDERVPFTVPPQSKFVVTATRGPVSEQLLAGPDGHKPGVYGDPVWILPQFYRPQVEKKWKIGAILHLSELKDRSPVAIPRDNIRRFDIPAELADDVHLITTCAPISMQAIGDKIDEILACERIVSTSLHGMVIAESYGIPCLYFAPNGDVIGPAEKLLDPQGDLDLRIIDLYRGLGKSSVMTLCAAARRVDGLAHRHGRGRSPLAPRHPRYAAADRRLSLPAQPCGSCARPDDLAASGPYRPVPSA